MKYKYYRPSKSFSGSLNMFRNMKELHRYLVKDRNCLPKVDKVISKIPRSELSERKQGPSFRIRQLGTHVNVIDQLTSKLHFVDDAIVQLSDFLVLRLDKHKPMVAAYLREFKKDIEDYLEKVHKDAHKLAVQKQPPEFKFFCKSVFEMVSQIQKPNIHLLSHVSKYGDKTITVQYFIFQDLPSEEYLYNQYYMVVVGIKKLDGSIVYKTGTFLEFVSPTKLYDLKTAETPEKVIELFYKRMVIDDMDDDIVNLLLPYIPDVDRAVLDRMVETLYVDEHNLLVITLKQDRTRRMEEIARQLFADIESQVGKGNIEYSSPFVRPTDGKKFVRFQIVENTPLLTKEKLNYLASIWKLGEAEKRRLKKLTGLPYETN